MNYTLSLIWTYREKGHSTGFDTIHCFRQPLGLLECIPHAEGETTAVVSVNKHFLYLIKWAYIGPTSSYINLNSLKKKLKYS